MNIPQPAPWLAKIAQIQRMERGKLTVMRKRPHYKLQSWENGKNHSRYVARDQAAVVEQAIAGYRQFQELTAQYAQAVIARTCAELAATSKKKHCHRRRQSSWPSTRKSRN